MAVAVVGLGYWGPRLLRNAVAVEGPDQVVAVDHSIDRLASVGASYPGVRCLLSLDAALDEPDVEAVVVATPVGTHAELARRALEAGRHVLVEKPLAATAAQAYDLVMAAQERALTLMVGHTFLFSPRVEKVAEYLDNDAVGEIYFVTSTRVNLGLHRSDADVIWDLAPHDFSVIFHLLGEFPVSVQTSGRSVVRPGLLDAAFMNLVFPSGAVGSVTVSWLAPKKVRNTIIVGERKMIVYDDTESEEPIKIYDRGVEVPGDESFGEFQLTYRQGDIVAPHVPAHEPLSRELSHFLSCIRTGEPCLSDGWFGLRVVEALEAAQLSYRRRGTPIAVRRIDMSARV